MAYRTTYLRVNSYGYTSRWQNDADQDAFKVETRKLFQELGWTLHAGGNGICDTVTKGQHLHSTSFSGVLLAEDNIATLQEQLLRVRTFRCYAVDCYEEYTELTDNEYRAALEAKQEEITAYILKQYKAEKTNCYVVDAVPMYAAQKFEIRRVCDRGRQNRIGNRFVSELIAHLINSGQLVTAETDCGLGIRTATEKELKARHQPSEQIDGQIAMVF